MNFESDLLWLLSGKPEGSPVCPHCGFDQQAEQPFLALPLGTLLNGRYVTGKVLGVGGFGITYLGYDLTLEIKVAIKEYMPSGLATPIRPVQRGAHRAGPGGVSERHGAIFGGGADSGQAPEHAQHRFGAELFLKRTIRLISSWSTSTA